MIRIFKPLEFREACTMLLNRDNWRHRQHNWIQGNDLKRLDAITLIACTGRSALQSKIYVGSANYRGVLLR